MWRHPDGKPTRTFDRASVRHGADPETSCRVQLAVVAAVVGLVCFDLADLRDGAVVPVQPGESLGKGDYDTTIRAGAECADSSSNDLLSDSPLAGL